MAMIKCIECGKEISDTAECCPYCGHKTRYGKEVEDKKGYNTLLYIGVVVLVIGIVLFVPALFTLMKEYDDWYFWNWNTQYANSIIGKISIGAGLIGGGTYFLHVSSKKGKR